MVLAEVEAFGTGTGTGAGAGSGTGAGVTAVLALSVGGGATGAGTTLALSGSGCGCAMLALSGIGGITSGIESCCCCAKIVKTAERTRGAIFFIIHSFFEVIFGVLNIENYLFPISDINSALVVALLLNEPMSLLVNIIEPVFFMPLIVMQV